MFKVEYKLRLPLAQQQTMDPNLFRDSSAGRVIRVGKGETAYHAFVPYPLPPTYLPSLPLMQSLSGADRAIGELGGLGRSLTNPHLLLRPFIRREAVLSSRIEGTQANVADLYAFEAGQPTWPDLGEAPTQDVREVYNYVLALEYGLDRLASLPLSLRLIRELHTWLMTGVRGEYATPGDFRRTQNWIGPPGSTLNSSIFVPPPVEQMTEALYEFEGYLHSRDPAPPLLRLAAIHYQFEAIHPFVDGNGRIGRLLLSLLLVHWQILPLPLLYLSAYFEKHRHRYYDLLLGVSEHGAWEEWFMFFLAGVEEQSQDAIERAKRIQDLQTEWLGNLQRSRFTGLLAGVTNYLFERPLLSANDVRDAFGVSHATAMRTLRRLEELGIVTEKSGQSRNQQFVAERLLQLFS